VGVQVGVIAGVSARFGGGSPIANQNATSLARGAPNDEAAAVLYHLSKVGVGALSPNICESINAVMDEFSVVMGRPRATVRPFHSRIMGYPISLRIRRTGGSAGCSGGQFDGTAPTARAERTVGHQGFEKCVRDPADQGTRRGQEITVGPMSD